MKILMVCAEYAPLIKTGGLADAAAGLSDALAARGHEVRVLLPWYEHLAPTLGPARSLGTVGPCPLLEGDTSAGGPTVYFLQVPGLHADGIYTGDERDAIRFIHLTNAAIALPQTLGWEPDVVHCHDWHAGLVPALQDRQPTVLTVHNLGYQGVFPKTVFASPGAPRLRFAPDARSGDATTINFLEYGIRGADLVTTVSPTYAREIQSPEYGMGLDPLLRERASDLVGILNGVDYTHWGPSNDPFIEANYDARDPSPKAIVKASLCRSLYPKFDTAAPVIGFVSRLVSQKGVDLLIEALPNLISDTGAGFALLGSGEAGVERALASLSKANPDRVSFTRGHNEPLAHRIFAGSDCLLVPSRYEPCGLTQMYAMRYGTIPVVRATGGLADTVEHFDPDSGRGTGSVFEDADAQGLEWGVRCAIGWFDDKALWSRLITNAMDMDCSWGGQVPRYEDVYRRAVSR